MAKTTQPSFIPPKAPAPLGPKPTDIAPRAYPVPTVQAMPNQRPPGQKAFGEHFTLSGMQDAVRGVTRNPIGASLLTAGITGLGGYLAAPYIAKLISPGTDTDELEQYNPNYRANLALIMAALGGAMPLAFNYNKKLPGYGLTSYLPKQAAFDFSSGHDNPASISLGDAYREIANSDLTPVNKDNAVRMLNAFNDVPGSSITTADIINTAISSGMSAATGGAIGYLTATALGLPHPGKTALLFGAINGALTGYNRLTGV